MKILQIGPVPPEMGGKTTGGVATHVRGLSAHLFKRGHEVGIFADNLSNNSQPSSIVEGIRIYKYSKLEALRRLPYIFKNIGTIYSVKKHFRRLMSILEVAAKCSYYYYVLARFKPDVVHVHHLEYRFPFVYFVSKGRVPIVTTVHSANLIEFSQAPHRQKYYQLIADNLKFSQNLIFISKQVKEKFSRYFTEFKGNNWVINNPFDDSRFYPVEKEDARKKCNLPLHVPIVLFVGSLTGRKGEKILLEATKILICKEIDFRVIIIGDGPELVRIKQLVVKGNLSNNVQIIRHVSQSELLWYYNASDLFIMPSSGEGFALVYLEALACGVPIIGGKGASEEVIASERQGFIVDPFDVSAVAGAIELGFKKKWNKEKLSEYARCFAWDKQIGDFENVYATVIKEWSKIVGCSRDQGIEE